MSSLCIIKLALSTLLTEWAHSSDSGILHWPPQCGDSTPPGGGHHQHHFTGEIQTAACHGFEIWCDTIHTRLDTTTDLYTKELVLFALKILCGMMYTVFGASLTEPHTSVTALLDACVCVYVCLREAIYRKFKLSEQVSSLHTC